MARLIEHRARWNDGQLSADCPLPQLFERVMGRDIAVLHEVFPRDQLTQLRDAVHAWGKGVEMKPPQTYIDENFHSVESGISPRQRTPHNYHAYNFNRLRELDAPLFRRLNSVFEPLRVFQNNLTCNAAMLDRNSLGQKLHPQIIHYPAGGGMFGRHVHPLEPQRIGLILAISARGSDFGVGATHFEVDGEDIGTDEVHDIGDMILFRFDVPHWITPIDPQAALDYASSKGRWTLVLPFY